MSDDLATLRKVAEFDWVPGTREEHAVVIAALSRVEAEIARLESELTEWRTSIATEALIERAEKAEAENARLDRCLTLETERAVAAEGREFRLRDGLRDAAVVIEKMANGASRKDVEPEFSRFRALLADQDGAAHDPFKGSGIQPHHRKDFYREDGAAGMHGPRGFVPDLVDNPDLVADQDGAAWEGEYHAEGLDERGIYGGRAHEPGGAA